MSSLVIRRSIRLHVHRRARKGSRTNGTDGQRRSPGRVPRVARLLALAIHFGRLLQHGVVRDYTELARLGIHTGVLCGANPFDYLTELQRDADQVAVAPADWLPRNYRATWPPHDSIRTVPANGVHGNCNLTGTTRFSAVCSEE